MCEGVELMTASARRTASTHIHSARVYSWVVRYCASTHDTEAAVTHAPEGIEESEGIVVPGSKLRPHVSIVSSGLLGRVSKSRKGDVLSDETAKMHAILVFFTACAVAQTARSGSVK